LKPIPNSNRPFNFDETTPATTTNTSYSVSDILFSPDGSKLVADVKGVIQENTPGFLAVWDVNSDGSLSATHQTFPAPTNTSQQNFGMTYIQGLEGYAVADAAIGGIFYDFSRGYGPQFRARNIVLPGQLVTCWVSYSNKSDSYFFTDAISDTLYEVTLDLDTLNGTVINERHMGSQSINLDSAVGTIGNNQ
jgi:WD40 repeat protein